MDVIGIRGPKRNVQSGKRGLTCRELADDREPAEKGRKASGYGRKSSAGAVRNTSETLGKLWGRREPFPRSNPSIWPQL